MTRFFKKVKILALASVIVLSGMIVAPTQIKAEPYIGAYRLEPESQNKMNKKIKQIAKEVKPGWSDLSKALYLHDYLVMKNQYDMTFTKFTAYHNLVEKTSVCQGYSEAYYLLCKEVGLECEIVNSRALNHAWNIVKINGKKYHVDVTWDDPVPDQYGRVRHTFFLKSSDYMKANKHNASDWVINGGGDIKCSSKKYDKAFWNTINSKIVVTGKNIYTSNGQGAFQKMTYSKEKKNYKVKKVVADVSGVWKASENSHWTENYSGVEVYKGKIYYSTPKQIYSYNPSNNEKKLVYTLPASEGYNSIFAITISDKGALYARISAHPNQKPEKIKKVVAKLK